MQVTPWMVYWITRLDSIHEFLVAATIVLSIFSFFSGVVILAEEAYNLGKAWIKLFILNILFALMLVFTPTSKEMCAIIIIPKIANNENLQGLGTDLIDLARDWVKELKPEAEVK